MTFTNTKGSFWSWEVRKRELAETWPKRDNIGYAAGGGISSTQGSDGITRSIEKIDFINETISSSQISLVNLRARGKGGTIAEGSGWFGGGAFTSTSGANPATNSIEKINFIAKTTVTSPATLSIARSSLAATSGNGFGWFGGGYFNPTSPGSIFYSTIDRLNFSAETSAVSPARLSNSRNNLAATNGNGFGWFGGGSTPASVSTIDRLNFSAETLAVSPATLSTTRSFLAATNGNGFGWFGGGFGPSTSSTIDRLNFSAETLAVSPAVLPSERWALSATTGNNSGWFAGGATPSLFASGVVQKLNFQQESVVQLPQLLNTVRRYPSLVSGGIS